MISFMQVHPDACVNRLNLLAYGVLATNRPQLLRLAVQSMVARMQRKILADTLCGGPTTVVVFESHFTTFATGIWNWRTVVKDIDYVFGWNVVQDMDGHDYIYMKPGTERRKTHASGNYGALSVPSCD